MKHLTVFFITLILPVLLLGNDKENALFLKGNACYAKSQYAGALAAYHEIMNDGYQSAALYFNMGNAFYKAGDIASALLYFEKAHKLSPGDDDINFNIRLANSKTTDKINDSQLFITSRWWRAFILAFSSGTLSICGVLFLLSGSTALTIYFFAVSFNVKRTFFYTAIILFLSGIITILVANAQAAYFDEHHEAIVFESSVAVKSAPSNGSAGVSIIHEGTKVDILEIDNGWIKIRLANGNEGWMKMAGVRQI